MPNKARARMERLLRPLQIDEERKLIEDPTRVNVEHLIMLKRPIDGALLAMLHALMNRAERVEFKLAPYATIMFLAGITVGGVVVGLLGQL